MRWYILSILAVAITATATAHHPDRQSHRVHPYYDVIGPLGRHLPPSHRRKLNRPTKTGGRITYYIAPSSQEAMTWHNAQHRGHYKNHRPRMVVHYFYPKPWEALRVGPRVPTDAGAAAVDVYQADVEPLDEGAELIEQPVGEPIVGDAELIEE